LLGYSGRLMVAAAIKLVPVIVSPCYTVSRVYWVIAMVLLQYI